jgi:DNA-binding Lrp family transcriptional regulator
MPEAFKVDRLDLRILAQLQKNGRMTNVDLADAVGLSPSPCLIRVKRLEQAGYIAATARQLRLEKLGDTLTVFTEVTLTDHHREDFARFEAAIREVDEILECHLVSGGYDYLLRFLTRGVNHYQESSRAARAQHRHREVLQLHRHQVAVHQEPLSDRAAVPHQR